MVTVGLLAILNARSGKEDELASFLEGALPLAQAEDDTIAWFAFKIDDTTYGIFDVFPGSTAARPTSTDPSRRRCWAGPKNC